MAAEAAERAKLWETLACNRGKVATLDRHGRTIATPNSVKELAGFTADMSDDCSTEALALVQLRKGEMTLPAAATAPLAVVSRGLHCQGKPVAVTAATFVGDTAVVAVGELHDDRERAVRPPRRGAVVRRDVDVPAVPALGRVVGHALQRLGAPAAHERKVPAVREVARVRRLVHAPHELRVQRVGGRGRTRPRARAQTPYSSSDSRCSAR